MAPFGFPGYLPFFLIFTSIQAFLHALVCYLTPAQTSMRLYSGPAKPQRTLLLAHVYGMKNIYTSAIRVYAAFYITEKPMYDLALLTYIGVMWLNVTEMFVWKNVGLREAVFPYINAGVGLLWMISSRAWYLGH